MQRESAADRIKRATKVSRMTATRASAAMPMSLVAIKPVARDTSLFTFARTDGGAVPGAEAGAHIILQFPNRLVRQYSLVDPHHERGSYTIGVKRDPASRGGSSYLHETMKIGDALRVLPPRNLFPLDETADTTVLFAGGIGITPIYAMMRRLKQLGRPYRLNYACRTRADMAFRDSLIADPALHHLHFDDEAGGPMLIADLVKVAPRHAYLYCCGPGPMLAAFEAAVTADARARETIHVEYFTPKT
jgi:tetrachlorobenzoquinone reductase